MIKPLFKQVRVFGDEEDAQFKMKENIIIMKSDYIAFMHVGK